MGTSCHPRCSTANLRRSKSRSRTNTRSWSRSLRIRARSSSRSSRGSGKVQPHLRQETPPYAGDRSPYGEVRERTARSASLRLTEIPENRSVALPRCHGSRARIVGVRIEQLRAADLVIGNGSLAFRRDEPVNEGLAEVFLPVRMPCRIDGDDAILVEHALVAGQQNV